MSILLQNLGKNTLLGNSHILANGILNKFKSQGSLYSIRQYSSNCPRTVAALIIGDEILSGRIADTNAHFLAKECFNRGLELGKIEIVPDDMNEIGESVRNLSKKYDLVFTSGGIGPTHDDITYEAIGNAFNLPLKESEQTVNRMLNHGFVREDSPLLKLPEIPNKPKPRPLNASRMRMAIIPTPSSVIFPCDDLWVPLVTVNKNVSILPGVPRLFESMIVPYLNIMAGKSNSHLSSGSYEMKPKFFRKMIGSNLFEADLAPVLRDAQNKINREKLGIKIGSYPKWRPSPKYDLQKDIKENNQNEKSNVLITFVGRDENEVVKWKNLVKDKINGFDIEEAKEK